MLLCRHAATLLMMPPCRFSDADADYAFRHVYASHLMPPPRVICRYAMALTDTQRRHYAYAMLAMMPCHAALLNIASRAALARLRRVDIERYAAPACQQDADASASMHATQDTQRAVHMPECLSASARYGAMPARGARARYAAFAPRTASSDAPAMRLR